MKRYLLFEFDTYYPTGGWGDFVGSFDTIAELQTVDKASDHYQIVDSTTGQIIANE